MSIVKFAAPVSGLRGTLGGIIYSANKAGPYARTWSRGASASSAAQSSTRALLSEQAATWRTIDAGDRADWDTWAADPAQALTNALGETYYLSGFLWYVRMSRWLQTCGRAPLTTAPVDVVPAAPTILTLTVSVGATPSQITYAAGEFNPDYDAVIELMIAQSVGAMISPLQPVLIKAAQIPAGTSITITTEIAARFGTPAISQKAFARVYRQSLEGYRSAPYWIASDVVA